MVITVLLITSFLIAFLSSALNLSVPSIGLSFNASAAAVGWIVTSYLASAAAFALPFGKLGDTFGKRYIFLAGLLGLAAAVFLSGFTGSLKMMIFFRVLSGFFVAMLFSSNIALLVDYVDPSSRGRYVGLSTAALYIGLSVGPALGGFINFRLGWRSIFWISGGALMLMGIISWPSFSRIKEKRSSKPLDKKGIILYTVSSALFFYGLSNSFESKTARISLIVSIFLFLVFIFLEKRTANPVLPVGIFTANKIFLFANLATLIHYSATFAITYLMSIYLQLVLGLTSDLAGLILLVQPFMMAACSYTTGALSDRMEPRILATLGMVLMMICLMLFALFLPGMSLPSVIVVLVFLGLGYALFSAPNTNSIMGSVPPDFTGVASSIASTMRLTGQVLSMAIVTIIVTIYGKGVTYSEFKIDLLTKTVSTCFFVFGLSALSGVFLSWSRGNKNER